MRPLAGSIALRYFSIDAHSSSDICAIVYFDCTSISVSVRDSVGGTEIIAVELCSGRPGSSNSSISADGNLEIAACFSGSVVFSVLVKGVDLEEFVCARVPNVPNNYRC